MTLEKCIANLGLDEIKSFTFISPKKIIPESDFNDDLQIINPISNELSMMRNSFYPNLLVCGFKNYAKGFDSFSLFEMLGDIFKGLDSFNQQRAIGLIISGFHAKKSCTDRKEIF